MKKYGIRPCELGLLVLFSWKSWQMAAKTAWSAKLIYIKCVDTDKHGQIKQCIEPWWLAILCQLYYYSCADWFPTRITLCSSKPMQTHYTEMAFTFSSLHRGSTPFFASDPSYKKHVEEEKDLFLNCFFFKQPFLFIWDQLLDFPGFSRLHPSLEMEGNLPVEGA